MRKFVAFLFLITSCLSAFAQGHSVDLVTGTLTLGVPLFSIDDGGVSVPVTLGYAGCGVRVNDEDGWLGHGWGVSGEGYRISREVKGIPDDLNETGTDARKGWLNGTMGTRILNFTINDDNNASTCTDEVPNYTILNGFGKFEDTQPDVYYVNAPGLSFQFYFDENKIPRVVPYEDVQISWVLESNGNLKEFTVVDDQGVRYDFTAKETITEFLNSTSLYYFVRKTTQFNLPMTYAVSWCLTKITSPVYGSVNISYRTINTDDDDFTPNEKPYNSRKYKFPLVMSNNWGAGVTLKYYRSATIKIIDKVTSPIAEAHFFSAPKYTGSVLERLNSIKLFDKRNGSFLLVKEYLFTYSVYGTDKRNFLNSVKEKTTSNELVHSFTYNMPDILPKYNSIHVDDWGYFKIKNPTQTDYQYDETAAAGSLRSIVYPTKGYTAFFYETNQFWDGTKSTQGAGIRIKKIINYDGVSSDHDQIQDYQYTLNDGNSSGKLAYNAKKEFSVARQFQLFINSIVRTTPRYREIQLMTPPVSQVDLDMMFSVKSDEDLGTIETIHGSHVAYSKVKVSTKGAGYRIYEYDIPAMDGDNTANNNEWQRSKVLIARPSAPNPYCFEKPNIPGGYNHYPFPVNPNYDFARALLTKVTDYRDDDVKVGETTNIYQRIYGGSSIRKIYGLALEELPTYYHNGTIYVDSKMFLFSKYAINTEVKTVLQSTTETMFFSNDLLRKTTSTTNYYYGNGDHRYLTRTETLNSDGSTSINRYKYVKDYNITSPSGTEATGIFNLRSIRRYGGIIESTSSLKIGQTEKYLSANLITFSSLYPNKTYSFTSSAGLTTFTGSSSTASSFNFDQTNYVLDNTFLSYDNYGNPKEIMTRDKDVIATVFGYNGTLPILNVAHARLNEIVFSNFDLNGFSTGITLTWSATTCPGRNGTLGINVPASTGNSNFISAYFTPSRPSVHVVSFWAKSATSTTVNVLVGSGSTTVTTPIQVIASSDYKYYSLIFPVNNYPSSYWMKIWSGAPIQLDDLTTHPVAADLVFNTYQIPFGKIAETDSHGQTTSYEYDDMGRLKVVYDRDKNILKTYDYRVKPN